MTLAASNRVDHLHGLGIIPRLRAVARRGLAQMYRPDEHLFGFTIRGQDGRNVLEGRSRRYTAITLIGLAEEAPAVRREILAGQEAASVWETLAAAMADETNLGDVALTLWAGLALGCADVDRLAARLAKLDPVHGLHPTVEVAWALTSLSIDAGCFERFSTQAERIAERLLESFVPDSGLFPHWPAGSHRSWLRGHVACFADVVYPIQALSHYSMRTGDGRALSAARRCAGHAAAHQGAEGQWWWHFDVRTGRVVEGYPVYSVHQDAMAPMAMFALRKASGDDHGRSIDRGVQWLMHPPELAARAGEAHGVLVDGDAQLIWRKVARHEPGKLARSLQAAASRVHPALRVPGVDVLFPAGWIDRECRPYHLGWLLYAWSDRTLEA